MVIELDPRMIFGTGQHVTTRLCLVALERYLRPGTAVLDLGTGSGILAIAAAKLGASSVLALDIDSRAVAVARSNVQANGVAGLVAVEEGSLPRGESAGRSFDLVMANIVAEVIEELAHSLARSLKADGVLIAGGIVGKRLDVVVGRLEHAGVGIVEVLAEGVWRTVVAQAKGGRSLSLHRFFIPPEWIDQDKVVIKGEQVHQLRKVLRMVEGDRILVLDNSGWEYEVELKSVERGQVEGVVQGKSLSVAEPHTRIVLYQALLKGEKFEFILQKGTELGVVGFVPMLCQRCVVGHVREVTDRKLDRWQRIIAEAAEQSRRGKLPFLRPLLPFEQACQSAQGLSLLAWEGERSVGLRAVLRAQGAKGLSLVNLFIGPEGGFSPAEVEFAQGCGVLPITLGSRVLRAETAGLVAATAIFYECGDLDPPD